VELARSMGKERFSASSALPSAAQLSLPGMKRGYRMAA